MKALKSKSLMSLIYAVLLALPFCAILSRVIYVQSNKNAYQSYSGQENEYVKSPVQSMTLNELYHFDSSPNYTNTSTQNTGKFGISELTNIQTSNTSAIPNLESATYLQYYFSSSLKALYYYDENNVNIGSNAFTTETIQFDFRLTSYVEQINNNLTMFSKLDIQNNSYMDNVFEYSVSQFVSENDFGQLNFFQWFDELLLTNNSYNALYIHFANWFLNYAMLISLMQILFLVLMWFVNFARKLLDRGMNYDW